jgi:hypothetical protein
MFVNQSATSHSPLPSFSSRTSISSAVSVVDQNSPPLPETNRQFPYISTGNWSWLPDTTIYTTRRRGKKKEGSGEVTVLS